MPDHATARGPSGPSFRVNGASPQAAGLVAWWPTAGQAGLFLRDYTYRYAPAAFPAGAAAPARVGAPVVERALSCDGAAQYADIGQSFSQAQMNPITVTCWLRPLATAAGDYVKAVVAQDADVGGRAFALGQMGDQLTTSKLLDALYLEVNGSGVPNYIFAPTAMTLGQWYHGAWTYDGTTHNLYQNGLLVATSATMIAPPAATTTCTIGRRNYTGFNGYFNGQIADIRLYNRALPAGVIQQMWAVSTRWGLFQAPLMPLVAVAPQVAGPASDVSAGGWTTAPLWSNVDETVPDDTTVIQSSINPNADTAEMALAPVTDPAASTGHIVRYRIRLGS